MTQLAFDSRTGRLLRLMMVAFWLGGVLVTLTENITPAQRGILFATLILFAILWMIGIRQELSEKHIYLILGLQTIIVTAASLTVGLINILYLPICLLAILQISPRRGLQWTGLLILLNVGIQFIDDGFNLSALRDSIINGGILYFIATFAVTLLRADAAQNETQQVLDELQDAHRQLQTYAAQVEELAVAEERNRLSREVHDTLGHRLTVSIVQLEGAERLVARQPDRATEKIVTVRQQLDEGLGELRRTVAMLRAPSETDLALPKVLIQLAKEFEEATQLSIQVAVPDSLPRLSDGYRLALHRVAQEALTNIQRHAQAEHAFMSLQLSSTAITLQIQDDGIGISNDAEVKGFGLRGIHERAAQLGGDVQVTAVSPQGTTLIFRLPRINGDSHDD